MLESQTLPASLGAMLRYWRQQKSTSQLDLALTIGTSTRHLSFIETGRAKPSRPMLLKVAEALKLSFRQRNALLLAAGYPSAFENPPLDAAEMGVVQQALQRMLEKHEPYPALVVNASYDILMHNRGFERVMGWCVGPAMLCQYRNIYRLTFAPEGLWHYFKDWPTVEQFLLARLLSEVVSTQNPALRTLYAEILAQHQGGQVAGWQNVSEMPVLSFTLQKDQQQFSFFSTITTLGTPLDVTTQELRIEAFFPADDATRVLLNQTV